MIDYRNYLKLVSVCYFSTVEYIISPNSIDSIHILDTNCEERLIKKNSSLQSIHAKRMM